MLLCIMVQEKLRQRVAMECYSAIQHSLLMHSYFSIYYAPHQSTDIFVHFITQTLRLISTALSQVKAECLQCPVGSALHCHPVNIQFSTGCMSQKESYLLEA